VMVNDPVTTATPLLNGVVVQQRIPAGGFTNASLNGNMVIYLTGRSVCGGEPGSVPKAGAGLLTANGNGAFSFEAARRRTIYALAATGRQSGGCCKTKFGKYLRNGELPTGPILTKPSYFLG